ncbi:cell division regulator GpsB [Granulicatella adiacens ATCC 49175]|jgi:cell cycle protein gpsB|uniref:DivIVA domain protein n=1 Tax=Granulicatella adiacens ATCC 49175 TaxID=638301 RepID=C8NEI7_9LACT|nr:MULTISPECIES: cell division regulator GpsB [Granulicatella]RKW27056.1 MAG: cell division regulator GpsB [Granulicatella sp.]EEW38088.1 DivIVA domain protein [Granulicatella adiacens ATCC 49175]MCT2160809.1 cell division regulator GpsB [Granulicatella adiacens]OFT01889.1 cell division protein GpsB [Granulicatella sp. HMSC31F03]OFT81811.1 cell division protein GpsB [Granulicatella sp. HMSC30F09]
MARISLSTKDILQKQFKRSFRGFDIEEVDAFLDLIIRDYDTFQKEISFLQAENERLLTKVDELSRQATVSKVNRTSNVSSSGVTNFDILKRLSNLEKHVFDSKLEEGNGAHSSLDSTEDDDDFYKTRVITPLRDNDY